MELCPSLFLSLNITLYTFQAGLQMPLETKLTKILHETTAPQLLHFSHTERREMYGRADRRKALKDKEEEFHGIIPSDNQS